MPPEPTQESAAAPAMDWAAWLQRHSGKLYYFAVHWNADDPENELQHAVVQTARAVTEGRCEAEDTAALRYAYTTLRRHLHRSHEKGLLRRDHETAWEHEHRLLYADGATEEECRDLEDALRQLPPQEAEIIMLHLWENMSFADIGSLLDLNRNTVSARYRKALSGLRHLLRFLPE